MFWEEGEEISGFLSNGGFRGAGNFHAQIGSKEQIVKGFVTPPTLQIVNQSGLISRKLYSSLTYVAAISLMTTL